MRQSDERLIAEYAAAAGEYDRKWKSYVDATIRETLARLDLRGDERVLDVGCGTGELLRQIGARYPGAKLAGIDPVAPMLEVARRKLPPGVDLRTGWANGLPWPDGSFDVVVSCNVFHYVTHPVPALSEMSRVLAPAGKIVITDWCDDYLACRLCSVYLRWTGAAFHKIYRAGECEDLFRDAGYATRIERYKISWLWGLMTASAVRASPAAGAARS
jgi:ubiquinone/menaquinone biosynthesis C-methylase UbiE